MRGATSRWWGTASTTCRHSSLRGYLFAIGPLRLPVTTARTVAVTVLIVLGLSLIVVLEDLGIRRLRIVSVAVLALGGLYAMTLAIPFTRRLLQTRRSERHDHHDGAVRLPVLVVRPAIERLHHRGGRDPKR